MELTAGELLFIVSFAFNPDATSMSFDDPLGNVEELARLVDGRIEYPGVLLGEHQAVYPQRLRQHGLGQFDRHPADAEWPSSHGFDGNAALGQGRRGRQPA